MIHVEIDSEPYMDSAWALEFICQMSGSVVLTRFKIEITSGQGVPKIDDVIILD